MENFLSLKIKTYLSGRTHLPPVIVLSESVVRKYSAELGFTFYDEVN